MSSRGIWLCNASNFQMVVTLGKIAISVYEAQRATSLTLADKATTLQRQCGKVGTACVE